MWPFRRKSRTLRLEVEIVGLPTLVTAIHALAEARRYEAKMRAGMIRTKVAPAEKRETPAFETAFKEWLAQQDVSEIERGDLVGLWEALLGKRNSSAEVRARARLVLSAHGAPLPAGAA